MNDDVSSADLLREFIKVLNEHFAPLRATLLDGTISCRICAALVLSENADRHAEWHRSLTLRIGTGSL